MTFLSHAQATAHAVATARHDVLSAPATHVRPRALVVVDAQRGFIDGAPDGDKVLGYIHWLLDSPVFDIVIATRFINPDNSAFRRALGYTDMGYDNKNTHLDERVEQRADLVVSTYGYGISDMDMDYVWDALDKQGIDSVQVVGFDTDACVLACAYSLFDAGIVPVIDSRGCASSGGKEVHDAALRIAARNMRVL